MRILFKTRDYSNILRADIFDLLQVDTLSHNVIGGPRAAQFSAPAHLDSAWDYVRLLGCPVEVVGEDILRPIWWGRVNSITVPHGLMTFGVTLDGMANVVAVSYAQVNVGTAVPADQILTDWAINQLSVDLYGGYMLIVNKSQSEAAAAVAARDVYLREYGYPLQANDLAAGTNVVITCRGYWDTLGIQYYQNLATTSVVTTTQLATMLATGQFITGVVIKNASGISKNEFTGVYSTTSTIRDIAEKLMAIGTSTQKRLLATVRPDRVIEIYAEPDLPAVVQYMMNEEGFLETRRGQLVPPEECKTGIWYADKGIPPTIGGIGTIRPKFIDDAEYTAANGNTVYLPAGVQLPYDMTELEE
jgi:hypothetical protein